MLMCDSQQEAVMSLRAISFHFVHDTFEIKVPGPSVSISGASLLITILDAKHLIDQCTFFPSLTGIHRAQCVREAQSCSTISNEIRLSCVWAGYKSMQLLQKDKIIKYKTVTG